MDEIQAERVVRITQNRSDLHATDAVQRHRGRGEGEGKVGV